MSVKVIRACLVFPWTFLLFLRRVSLYSTNWLSSGAVHLPLAPGRIVRTLTSPCHFWSRHCLKEEVAPLGDSFHVLQLVGGVKG